MNTKYSAARKLLAFGGAAVTLGGLCALLLRGPATESTSSAAGQSAEAAASPAARPARPPRGTPRTAPADSPSRAGASAEVDGEDDGETAEARPSRREQYTAAFDRKIGRIQARIAEDCAEHEALLHVFDDFGEVRDRIVESAVQTDSGLKTKAEQRAFENAQLREFDAGVCRSIATLSLSRQCKRHFHSCEHVL